MRRRASVSVTARGRLVRQNGRDGWQICIVKGRFNPGRHASWKRQLGCLLSKIRTI